MPNFTDLMLPILNIIKDGKVHTNKTTEKELAQHFRLSEDDLLIKLSCGKRVFYDRLHWAKMYLLKSGLIENQNRGEFKITQEGLNLLEENIEKIDYQYLKKRYNSFAEYVNRNTSNSKNNNTEDENNEEIKLERKNIDNINTTPTEIIETSFEEINKSLEESLLETLSNINPYKFEHIVLDLIVRMGYNDYTQLKEATEANMAEVTKKSRDGGIDGIIHRDRLGLDDSIVIQAKRYGSTSISEKELREFVGIVASNNNKGIFITTSSFSQSAIKFIEQAKSQKISLIDGKKLCKLMIEYNVGIDVETTYEIKKINTDYFEEI